MPFKVFWVAPKSRTLAGPGIPFKGMSGILSLISSVCVYIYTHIYIIYVIICMGFMGISNLGPTLECYPDSLQDYDHRDIIYRVLIKGLLLGGAGRALSK